MQPASGFKTSEFWVTVISGIGGVIVAVLTAMGGPIALGIVGVLQALLTALGYVYNRTELKKSYAPILSVEHMPGQALRVPMVPPTHRD